MSCGRVLAFKKTCTASGDSRSPALPDMCGSYLVPKTHACELFTHPSPHRHAVDADGGDDDAKLQKKACYCATTNYY